MLKKKNTSKKFKLTPKAEKSFQDLQEAFTKAPLLKHFNPSLPLILFPDASERAITDILTQIFRKECHPITFYSRKLNNTDRNYSTPNQELLAIYTSIITWHQYLEGARHVITIFSNHTNLKTFTTTLNLNRHQTH
jgi:hypothetical protein